MSLSVKIFRGLALASVLSFAAVGPVNAQDAIHFTKTKEFKATEEKMDRIFRVKVGQFLRAEQAKAKKANDNDHVTLLNRVAWEFEHGMHDRLDVSKVLNYPEQARQRADIMGQILRFMNMKLAKENRKETSKAGWARAYLVVERLEGYWSAIYAVNRKDAVRHIAVVEE